MTPPSADFRIAITGHRGLPEDTRQLIDAAIRTALARAPRPMTGISCLADGADQMFARAVLDAGGSLNVIVPAAQYRQGLPEESHYAYDDLLSHADSVRQMPFSESTSEAHMAASRVMVEAADLLLAVWDGQPARGYGGTADIVHEAHNTATPVEIIWPTGAHRD